MAQKGAGWHQKARKGSTAVRVLPRMATGLTHLLSVSSYVSTTAARVSGGSRQTRRLPCSINRRVG